MQYLDKVGLPIHHPSAGRPMTLYQEETRNAMMRVFNFVVDYYETHHDFPTFHQIGQACQISRRTVSKYLDLLQEQGLIELPVAIA
jgi:DNA-binding transcriptional regulator LsrR (DeoR family)